MTQKFSEHLNLARQLWDEVLVKGDIAVDATCGNGHDTCYLAEKVIAPDRGFVYGYDIQKDAIEKTLQRLKKHCVTLNRVKLIHNSHIDFSAVQSKIKLVVYNLGYLPGSDKTITTLDKTTIRSLENCLRLKTQYISIMCYPGHSEGKKEKRAILKFLSKLSFHQWSVCHYQWINREDSPSLFFLKCIT